MTSVFILIEQALGYVLLNVKHCKSSDDLVILLQDKNFENIKGKIKLVQFQPFSSVSNASLNCQDIANGNANVDLIAFLKKHLSKGNCILIVSDRKLLESLKAANINDLLEFNGDSSMVMHLRRIRFSIHEFMEDDEKHLVRAHIGLGHSFSRMKIKFNVNRADNMIIQSINLMDQLDKDINTMSMRLREWFGYHYPELIKLVSDNRAYSTVVGIIGSRAGAVDDVLERLETVVGDSSRAKQIISNARTSMGYELTEEDFLNIGYLAVKTLSMMTQREDSAKYLASKMAQVAPNFSTLVGDIVAARLISHAGSLINLAKFPASTIQILGAEKALFRALKTRTNTPKYGLIFHSSFIGRAAKNDKGRISRFLAAKISLAVRLDCFLEEPMNIYGAHLKRQVEDQLKYLETGEEPRKNYEAMAEAVIDAKRYIAELKLSRGNIESSNDRIEPVVAESIDADDKIIVTVESTPIVESKKQKKMKRKLEKSALDNIELKTAPENISEKSKKENNIQKQINESASEKAEVELKKRKKDKKSNTAQEEVSVITNTKEIKKKKKNKNNKSIEENVSESAEVGKTKDKESNTAEEKVPSDTTTEDIKNKKKRINKKPIEEIASENVELKVTKDKKSKKSNIEEDEVSIVTNVTNTVEIKTKKKKSKKLNLTDVSIEDNVQIVAETAAKEVEVKETPEKCESKKEKKRKSGDCSVTESVVKKSKKDDTVVALSAEVASPNTKQKKKNKSKQ